MGRAHGTRENWPHQWRAGRGRRLGNGGTWNGGGEGLARGVLCAVRWTLFVTLGMFFLLPSFDDGRGGKGGMDGWTADTLGICLTVTTWCEMGSALYVYIVHSRCTRCRFASRLSRVCRGAFGLEGCFFEGIWLEGGKFARGR